MSQRSKAEVHAKTRRREKMEGKQAIVLDTDAASPGSDNANTSEDCGMTKKNAKAPILHATHGEFYESVADLLRNARANAYRVVNFTMVGAYWNIGRMIVAEENRELDVTLIDYGDLVRSREQWRNVYEVTEEFYTHNGKYGTREDVEPRSSLVETTTTSRT